MRITDLLYRSLLTVLPPILRMSAPRDSKIRIGAEGMTGAADRLAEWARRGRDPDRPLIWFHAPSVGEGLQALETIRALRSLCPEVQIAYTYFSPSARNLAFGDLVDVADFLPLDRPAMMKHTVEALAPAAIVFTKTEIWPVLTREAVARGCPVLLLSATLPESSSRLRWPGRWLLVPAHRQLWSTGAISTDVAERYGRLGVPADRRFVMGDARFDQVARMADSTPSAEVGDRVVLVAGSTWPEDDCHLIPAYARLADRNPRFRMILAPHEPGEIEIDRLERAIAGAGMSVERWGNRRAEDPFRDGEGNNDPRVLLVDRVGILGRLYAAADVAYVGGGFGTDGLHSVLEPAAFGAPVIFGPRHENAREAQGLLDAGAARSVTGTAELGRALEQFLEDSASRREAGNAAAAFVERQTGAAERGARAILDALESTPKSAFQRDSPSTFGGGGSTT